MVASGTQFPADVVDDKGNDLVAPLQQILRGINVWATADELAQANDGKGAISGPPASVSIIEAGASALSKWWSVAIGAVGGITVITAAITKFWDSETGGERIAITASIAAVIAAGIVAIAIMVSSDVRGRAAGAVAQYEARAAVATTFLQLTRQSGSGGSAVHIVPAASVGNGGSEGSDGNDKAPPNPNTELLTLLSLVGSAQRPAIRDSATGNEGELRGVRRTDPGDIELRIVTDGGGQDWLSIDRTQLVQFTYPDA